MLKTFRIGTTSLALMMILLLVLPGCRQPGAAERAGRQIDRAVEKTRQEVKKVGQDVDTAAKKIRKDIQGK